MLNTLKKLLWPQTKPSEPPASAGGETPALGAGLPTPPHITSLLGHGWTARYQACMKSDLSGAVACLLVSRGKHKHGIELTTHGILSHTVSIN